MNRDSDTTIVLIGDANDNIESLSHQLKKIYDLVYISSPNIKKIRKLEQLKINRIVIFYVFKKLESSVSFSAKLDESEILAHLGTAPKASYLLTHRHETEQAFKLCLDNVFDAYSSHSPIYDVNQVLITTKLLVDRLKLEQKHERQKTLHAEYVADNAIKLDELTGELGKLTELIETAHKTAPEELQQSLHSANQVYDKILHDLHSGKLKGREEAYLESIRSEHLVAQVDATKNYARAMLKAMKLSTSTVEGKLVLLKQRLTEKSNNKKVALVVDDQDTVRNIIAGVLEKAGYFVVQAADGVEALLKAELSHPDIILLDISMPNMNGITFLQTRRKLTQVRHTPVIMLTGHTDKDHFDTCRQLGACDYIIKPTTAKVVLEKLKRIIETQH